MLRNCGFNTFIWRVFITDFEIWCKMQHGQSRVLG